MRDIHCPKDIGFENTFGGEDCEKEQHYNNCYHCWSTALTKGKAHWVMPVQDDGMSDPIYYQVRCSKGMKIIDADKFLAYLIYSKHIDGLTCGEVKEAIEMCKVDVLDKIRAEIEASRWTDKDTRIERNALASGLDKALEIIDKYKAESAYDKCPICVNRNKNCQFGSLDCHFEKQIDVAESENKG